MLSFVDSHAHLADPAFDGDRDAVAERARRGGAHALVCIGESLAAAERARAIAVRYPGFVYWTAGIHPHDAASVDGPRALPVLRDLLRGGAVAVGECGLDYHYEHSPRERQREVFGAQLGLASELRLPVIVHTREAENDTAAFLREARGSGISGVMHCFTGSRELAREALDAGWMISFSGIITFRKWADLELLRLVPDDRLLVETDAPYLAPVPHRGKRNEPSFLPRTIERLADVRGVAPAVIADVTSGNARRLFNLGAAA